MSTTCTELIFIFNQTVLYESCELNEKLFDKNWFKWKFREDKTIAFKSHFISDVEKLPKTTDYVTLKAFSIPKIR